MIRITFLFLLWQKSKLKWRRWRTLLEADSIHHDSHVCPKLPGDIWVTSSGQVMECISAAEDVLLWDGDALGYIGAEDAVT